MQVEVAPADGDNARLIVSLTPEDVNAAIESTYQRLGQRVKLAGFRPGKAPRALLLRTYGEEDFYHQATDAAIRKWYPRALAESGIEAIDQGSIDDDDDEHNHVVPGEPFSFTATVPTKPEIKLPDYGEIKIPPPLMLVTQEDVDRFIEALRLERATLVPAPGHAAEIGNVVKMSIHGRSQGEEVLAQDALEFELVDETDAPDEQLPGLSKELVGALPGDIREVVLNLPPDYRDQPLAGHGLSLRIVVKEIMRKVLPDLNDEFVGTVSRQAKTVQELKDFIRRNLEHERFDEAAGKVGTEVIDSLIARSNVSAPEVLVDDEQNSLLRSQRRYFERRGLSFDQFLIAVKKSEDEYRDELKPAAERNVKRDLILDAVAKAEDITPDPDVVDGRVRDMSEAVSKSDRDFERLAGSERLHETVATEVRRSMALAKLVEMASGLKPHEHHHDEEDTHSVADEAAESAVSAEPPDSQTVSEGQSNAMIAAEEPVKVS
ncbi:MAG TPA: trigger factor [Chloroflexota bacterium]|jgi:trigger factor|nr:trigger factor [Chloroflexota bacterium]